jgi:hypothetical protein
MAYLLFTLKGKYVKLLIPYSLTKILISVTMNRFFAPIHLIFFVKIRLYFTHDHLEDGFSPGLGGISASASSRAITSIITLNKVIN